MFLEKVGYYYATDMAHLIEHRRARFDYEILEIFEAGMQLFGGEVKSLRDHKGKIEGAHAVVRGGEVFLVGMEIPPYQNTRESTEYDAKRVRKLLLNKKEIRELAKSEETRGLTIVPLALYNKGRVIKISIAIARGKKKGDKRESIKKRESERDIAREVKYRG